MNRSVTIAVLLVMTATGHAASNNVDVVVYGGTPAGVIAAQAAAKEGMSVVLVEPGRHVGGMCSGGLGHTDRGRIETIGGLSREFFERVGKHYGKPIEWYLEPHVAEQAFLEILAEAKVPVQYEHRLRAMQKDGGRIRAIELDNGAAFTAKMFIDASYEGDLMARAGVSYVIGRERRDQYGEPLAGVQAVPLGVWDEYRRTAPKHGPGYSSLMLPTIEWYKQRPSYLNTHQWPVQVSGLDEQGRLLPGVTGRDPGKPGSGDKKFQTCNFRLCLTKRADNRVPIERPAKYDPRTYELLARYIALWPDIRLGQLVHLGALPNDKFDVNTSGPYSTDYLGASWDYPEADHQERQQIWQDHKEFLIGFFHFLGHDPRVPEPLRMESLQWGLARDEFVDTDHWPRELYVRVARRMLGATVMTQKDVQTDVGKSDSIGMGSFIIDSHNVQRVLTRDGFVINEGGIEVPAKPYQIPYGVITPKETECANLFVPGCLSASYIAHCTLRMEPVFMHLGHAAGVAAALAIRADKSVQQVDYAALCAKLLEQKQVLALGGALPDAHALDSGKLAGIVVDNDAAEFSGDWESSQGYGTYVGPDYRHDANQGKGEKTTTFKAKLPKSGRYAVRVTVAAYGNRATNVPVRVRAADGEHRFTVDQRRPPERDDPFKVLGKFQFDAAAPAVVIISNAGTDGYVIADAVQFLPAE